VPLTSISPSHLASRLSDGEREALRAFHDVVERVRAELDAAVEAAAEKIPVFQPILARMDPETRAAQSARSRRLERAAILAGEWEPYVANLREQGATYAHLGVEFRDWFGLLGSYRSVISDTVVSPELTGARQVLTGMGLFLDLALAEIGEAYVATKEAIVLRTQEQLDVYSVLFESSPLPTLVYNWSAPPDPSTFRLLSQNSAAAGIVARLRATGAHLEADVAERFASTLDRSQAQSWTARAVDERTGSERTYVARCFPLSKRFVGAIFEDVTATREMERELARHVRDLERSNRELDDFAYVASHDLKAPLRDVDSLARWVREDSDEGLSDESRRHLDLLQNRIGRMERLLDDLLQYSRAGRAKHSPDDVVDLRRAAEEAVAVTAPTDFRVGIEGAAKLRASPVAVEQIVRNLVDNAVKHHDREDGSITVAIVEGPGGVELAVKDDGPGIPAEFHERVFRMFQTLRPRDEKEGSGMGLAIVKKLAESQGGRVSLESGADPGGRGTTVRITWPPPAEGMKR